MNEHVTSDDDDDDNDDDGDDDDDDDDDDGGGGGGGGGAGRKLKRHFSQVMVSIRLSVSLRSHNILRLFCSSKRSCLTVNNGENKKHLPARSFLEFHPHLENNSARPITELTVRLSCCTDVNRGG